MLPRGENVYLHHVVQYTHIHGDLPKTHQTIQLETVLNILVPKTYRNSIRSVKTYSGADVELDHISVGAQMQIRRKDLKRKSYETPKRRNK